MKTVLVLAAALGLSVSAASAACSGHKNTTASTDQTTVASISGDASSDGQVKKEKN
ncbi:hypothetical protein [Aquamicrobium sp. LC103]|uniref:hypothetical protein n=1 Tax=Aquamicrobium sp. LC103 TaxID=1120658 RepID=UPI000AFE8D57|nr:hypothetical protein [Aquamicrobium sp. LC103]